MSKPGIGNYRFGQKNNWRRTVWNEMASRVKNRRDARILYLAGEQNLDSEIAEQKGFRKQNMIAIEIDKGRTASLRANSVNTINGNLMDVLYNWPHKHKVDVVVADFCFGFEAKSVDLFDSISNPALVDAACLINFQRGRDSSTNELRKMLGGNKVFTPTADGDIQEVASEKHRAAQYLQWHALETVRACNADSILGIETNALVSMLLTRMKPRFLSYRSGRIYMDSAVFNHSLCGIDDGLRSLLTKADAWQKRYAEDDPAIKSRITAALAVQSRRAA